MQLEDRFYTSTEVAEILGVSLRSVYRYLEDKKLKAEVKTATGRHRFTRDDILNFLYPDGRGGLLYDDAKEEAKKEERPKIREKAKELKEKVEKADKEKEDEKEVEEEPVDWLEKFREAATKYKEEQEPYQTPPQPVTTPTPAPVQEVPTTPEPQTTETRPPTQPAPTTPQPTRTGPTLMYYRSMLGGLKDIAQNLDKSARNSNLDYAFTLSAGASLHKPIKPFATLHAYIQTSSRDFFEKILRLTPSNQTNAQLCLVLSDDSSVYTRKEEVHGLFVVSKEQLKKDISTIGDAQLAQEMADTL